MIALTISIIALTISLILAVRLLLLDKDYGEFSIIDYGGNNTGISPNVFDHKNGYVLTLLHPKIQILKSDIYDIEITGIDKDSILPSKRSKIVQLKSNGVIEFNYFHSEHKIIKIRYRDSKNNLYEQGLSITPFYNNGSFETSKNWSITMSNRKWLFIKSLGRKYF